METTECKLIIGLYSPTPQSGKTTTAMLLENFYSFKRYSFASGIKMMTDGLLRDSGYSDRAIYDFKTKYKTKKIPTLGKSYRNLMQSLGQWGKTHIDPDFWVDHTMSKFLGNGRRVVIDDVRFPSEAQRIRKYGGKLIKIHRHETFLNSDECEGNLNDIRFDAVIDNTKDFDWLITQLRCVMAHWNLEDISTSSRTSK